MPQWPHDFPSRKTFLLRAPPTGPVSTFTIRGALSRLKASDRTVATVIRTVAAAAPRRLKEVVLELPGTIYWGWQRRSWSTVNGYIAARSSSQLWGTGALRIGILHPQNWLERRYPMQVWIPRKDIFRHVGVIGPTGAGKTTTLSIAVPWIAATAGQSVVMNDVKEPCEFFPWMVDWWRSWGRTTINFAPHTPAETLCCELLHSARRDELDIIAEALLAADSGQESGATQSGGNKFFEDAGKQFVAGLMRMFRFAPRRYCNLPVLFKIVAMGGKALVECAARLESYMPEVPLADTPPSADGRWPSEAERHKWEELRDACRIVVGTPANALEADGVHARTHRGTRTNAGLRAALEIVDRAGYDIHCWVRDARAAVWARAEEMTPHPVRPDWGTSVWKDREATLERLWRARVREWRDLMGALGTTFRQPETTFENIVMATQNSLKMFADDMVATAFSRPEFDFRTVAQSPTLFIVGAPLSRGSAGRFIASVFSKLVINTVFSRREKTPDVILLQEEAPTLKDKDLPQTLAVVRSNGGALMVIAQSDTQWKALMGEHAGTIDENLVNQIALKGTKGETAKRIAERFGVALVEKKSRSRNHGSDQSGGSTSTSIERVDRMTVNDVTDVCVNGESLGPYGAMACGTAVEPFFFTLMPYWTDPVIVSTLKCAPDAHGRLRPRENHAPYHRVKRTQLRALTHYDGSSVLAPDAYGRPMPQFEEILGSDGAPLLDPHAVDPMRDTVDFIEPPTRPTFYELDTVTLDVDDLLALGITPTTGKTLQEILERREAAARKGGGKAKASAEDPPPAASSSAGVGRGTPAPATASDPGVNGMRPRAWGWVYRGMLALESSYPLTNPAMPWVEWDEGRRGWIDIATKLAEARLAGPLGGPPIVVRPGVTGSSMVSLSETEMAAPLAVYLFLSAHIALDLVSWTNHHLRRAEYHKHPPSMARQLIHEVLTELDAYCNGIQAPEVLLTLWMTSGQAIAPLICRAMDHALEAVRDQLGTATTADDLAQQWAAARAQWYELAGDPQTPHTPEVAWRFALAECLTDFGALSRATFLDFLAVTDPITYTDDAIHHLLIDDQPKIHFRTQRAVFADIQYESSISGHDQGSGVPPEAGQRTLVDLLHSPGARRGYEWLAVDQAAIIARIEQHVGVTNPQPI